MPQPIKILHFIPQHGIGGVEIAAISATRDQSVNVHVHAVFNGIYKGPGYFASDNITASNATSFLSITSLISSLKTIKKIKPRVLVFSLWRTFPTFVAAKIFAPRCKFVVFVHNERTSGSIDRWVTAFMKFAADEIWVDSQVTLDARLSEMEKQRSRIISFRLSRPMALARSGPAPKFVYWGRLAPQKRIDRAVELFAEIARVRNDAEFLLIGPDHGMRHRIADHVRQLKLEQKVILHDPADLHQIEKLSSHCRFFIQLSNHEGMAMGVVEALERGLVPIVTPVGQIAKYCQDGTNSIIYRERNETADRVLSLLDNVDLYKEMSQSAVQTFKNSQIYSEDVSSAARMLCDRFPER